MDTSIENDDASLKDTDDHVPTGDDTSIQDSIMNTDDIVRNLVENTIHNPNSVSDHDSSVVDADGMISNSVESRISGNDSVAPESSLHTDDIIRGLAENETINTKADEKDDVLESMLESLSNNEMQDSVDNLEEDNSLLDSSHAEILPNELANDSSAPKIDRLCHLPTSKIRTIMRSDPEINIVGAEVVFLVSKSCELFLQWLGRETYAQTIRQKKKTIQKRDLDSAINEHLALEFLDGALD